MATSKGGTKLSAEKGQWFTTTSWTNLLRAQQQDSPEAREALERLCRTYWYPIYTYIRRSGSGKTVADAEDLTQAYFYQVLEKNLFGAADRKKGKFRSFLLAALGHFLANARDFHNALKRGGGKTFIDLDTATAEDKYLLEPKTDELPEKAFDRAWAEQVMTQARAALQEEYASKARLFARLSPFLERDAAPGDYTIAADELGLTLHAVTVAVHRLRERLGKHIRAVITPTVARPEEIESEMRYIAALLRATPE